MAAVGGPRGRDVQWDIDGWEGWAPLSCWPSGSADPRAPRAPRLRRAAIRVFQFQPGALEVRPGTRVMWTNQDDITHTVTSGVPGSPDGRFDSPWPARA